MVQISCLDTAGFTEKTYREILGVISEERVRRAERCRTEQKKYLSAAAGYLLACALKEAGISVKTPLSYGEHGKPCIGGLHFNLTHSGTVAVIAVADGEVGVDIQKISSVREKVIARVCTERERNYLDGFPGAAREREFFRLWTAKESAGKFLGTGITDPKEFEIDLVKSSVSRKGEALQASLKEYPLDGYSLTVCADELFAKALEYVGL